METFSSLLALCEGNLPVTDGFPLQRPVTQCFDVFFDRAHHDVTVMQSYMGFSAQGVLFELT